MWESKKKQLQQSLVDELLFMLMPPVICTPLYYRKRSLQLKTLKSMLAKMLNKANKFSDMSIILIILSSIDQM